MNQTTAPTCPAPVTSPTAAPAPAAKVLREVPVSCRCEQYLRGEPAPTEPLALVRLAKTEADAVEYLHRATCYRNSVEVRTEDGEGGDALCQTLIDAYARQKQIAQIVAQRWGVEITLQHDI